MTKSSIIMTRGVMKFALFKLITNSRVIVTSGIVTEAL